MSNYYVQFFRPGESYRENGKEYVTAPRWCETYSPVLPGPSRTEAERLAAKRSMNGRIYRVRKGTTTISQFQHGKQLTKEDQ